MGSFFKKPAWATKPGGAGGEFYRRSEQTYRDIVAAEREAHKRSKPPAEAIEEKAPESDRDVKKVRLSEEIQDELAPAVDNEESVESNNVEEPPRPSESIPTENISQDDEEREGLQELPSTHSLSTHRPDSPLPNSVDAPIEIKSPARQQSPKESDAGSSDAVPKEASRTSIPPTAPSTVSSPNPIPDPIVRLLVTSQIPNTKPLLINRKMSQSLREVRLAWAKHQGYTPEVQSDIYLTWKGRRLFDVTTCRSLGIKIDKSKNAFLDPDDDPDAVPKELRIHMVAATNNDQLLKQEGTSHTDEHVSPAPTSAGDEASGPMKLTLRSSAKEDLRIKARPTTLVSKLISVFRDKQSISDDQDILLLFDGDRLDPNACLGDYDIADLDLVDVQTKPRG